MSDVVRAAQGMASTIRDRADEIEQARRLPADLAKAIAEAGLFRMLVPKAVGGLEVAPHAFAQTLQTVAASDASVGWCVMIGATSGLTAAYLETEVARRIFGAPDTITGSVFAPMGRARVEGDAYRASGMRGTGSGDMAVRDARVPPELAVSLTEGALADTALYKFPVFGLLAVGIASVALGNAEAALDALRELATAKKPQFSRRTVAERPVAQADFARAQGRWRAARAYLDDAVERCWTAARREGALSVDDRADLRLACTHATRESAEVVTAAYELGGGTSVYAKHPLQRCFRDAHVATQHIMVAPPTYELAGRLLFGLDADVSML